MGVEIERKWLLKKLPDHLERYAYREIEQAYLNFSPVVRVRHDAMYDPTLIQEKYELTYKGAGFLMRREDNMPLDQDSYLRLRGKHEGHIIRKRRYMIPLPPYVAELDVFLDDFSGLFLVEVEFPDEKSEREFLPPSWFGEDVSESGKYSNSRLAKEGWNGESKN